MAIQGLNPATMGNPNNSSQIGTATLQVSPDYGAVSSRVAPAQTPLGIAKGRFNSTERGPLAWQANIGSSGINAQTASGYINMGSDSNQYKPVENR